MYQLKNGEITNNVNQDETVLKEQSDLGVQYTVSFTPSVSLILTWLIIH